MTPTALRTELTRLGLSQNALARMLAVDVRTARRWASGDQPIPRAVDILLHCLTPVEAADLLADAKRVA